MKKALPYYRDYRVKMSSERFWRLLDMYTMILSYHRIRDDAPQVDPSQVAAAILEDFLATYEDWIIVEHHRVTERFALDGLASILTDPGLADAATAAGTTVPILQRTTFKPGSRAAKAAERALRQFGKRPRHPLLGIPGASGFVRGGYRAPTSDTRWPVEEDGGPDPGGSAAARRSRGLIPAVPTGEAGEAEVAAAGGEGTCGE